MIPALDSLYSKYTKDNQSKYSVSPNDKLYNVIYNIAKKLKISLKGVEVIVHDHKGRIENKNAIYISPIWLASQFKSKDDLNDLLKENYSPEMIDFMYNCLTNSGSKKILKHLIVSNLIAVERHRQAQQLTDGRVDLLLAGIVALALLKNGCQSMPLILTLAAAAVIANHIFLIPSVLNECNRETPFQAALKRCPKTKNAALDFEGYLLDYKETLNSNRKAEFNPLIPFQ